MSKITNDRLNQVGHRMLYSCTHTATVGVKGLRDFFNVLPDHATNTLQLCRLHRVNGRGHLGWIHRGSSTVLTVWQIAFTVILRDVDNLTLDRFVTKLPSFETTEAVKWTRWWNCSQSVYSVNVWCQQQSGRWPGKVYKSIKWTIAK